MTLEADQAVQEARFAGACQDQHAGHPAPSLGWPGERKSIVQQAVPYQGYGLGPRFPGAWGPGLQGLGPGLGSGSFFVVLKKSPGGRQARGGRRLKRLPPPPPRPPPPPPAFLGCKGEKKRVFTPSVTETIQHATQGRRTRTGLNSIPHPKT